MFVKSLFTVFLAAAAPFAFAQPDGDAEGDWLETWYENPRPDEFIEQMKEWAADGTLSNEAARPALVAFLSQVIRQNEDKLDAWYRELKTLPDGPLRTLHTAMLFSRSAEGDRIMRERFGAQYEEQKTETKKILELPLDKEDTMDMLWGFFYATGSATAVRRVVLSFRFVDAPDDPDGVDVPAGHVPYYKLLPRFAYESLIVNGERHPLVKETLEDLLENDESFTPIEKQGVYDVLSELDSEAYPPKDHKGETA